MSYKITTRQEHLNWCKKRALQYCDAGDISQALASMGSDLNKHDETRGHSAVGLGLQMMTGGMLSTPEQMAEFIRGFN